METNLWQEIRASGRAPPARSGAQVGAKARVGGLKSLRCNYKPLILGMIKKGTKLIIRKCISIFWRG